MIKQDSIENLKSQLDIIDVVSNYIEVKKTGANFKALCPFHGERTPSLVISPSKQIYHCFGCGAGGDSVKFVMEYENLSYPEAIEKLANDNNFKLEYDNNFQKKDTKVLDNANLFFRKNLDNNEVALKYLQDRGISHSSIEKFEIGYAPDSNSTLNYLNANHISMQDSLNQGLIALTEDNRHYCRFIERITFPIYNQSNKMCGFGGRTISNHPAKYINSPQSEVFNKSKLLYGYNIAKDAIFKQKSIVITEGYLDVIMLHQVGFNNTVATLGTALTREHLPLIRRGEPKVILAYDGDSAGKSAAFKASELLSSSHIEGGVVLFGEGLDPADMVKNNQINELNELFANPTPFIPFCIKDIADRYDIKVPEEKQKALNDINGFLAKLSPVLQEEYKKYVSNVLSINEKLIKTSLNRVDKKINYRSEDIAELTIIKTLLDTPSLVSFVLEYVSEDMFNTHALEYSSILKGILDIPELTRLSLREDIKSYSEDELRIQLVLFTRRFYEMELKKVKTLNIDFSAKTYLTRKLQFYIQELKNRKLVVYKDELKV